MIKKYTMDTIRGTIKEAKNSKRRRAIFCYNEANDSLQRMINVCLEDTYIRPHKHENKLEIFQILTGIAAVVIFEDNGEIADLLVLDKNGPIFGVEIPPGTWHSLVVLSPEAVIYEIIKGEYNQKTHKIFPEWSPEEKNYRESRRYLKKLKSDIYKKLNDYSFLVEKPYQKILWKIKGGLR